LGPWEFSSPRLRNVKEKRYRTPLLLFLAVNFTNSSFFVNFLLTKNYKTQFVSTQKLLNTLKYEKSAHIILMIMTPIANFINVLRPFFVRNFGAKNYKAETVLASVKRSLYNFWRQNISAKFAHKILTIMAPIANFVNIL